MTQKEKWWFLIKGTLLSALIFSSVSFINIIVQLSPFHYYRNNETPELRIGFPWKFYYQFFLSPCDYNYGWNPIYWFYDCILTWTITMILYWLISFKKYKKT